MTQLHNELKKEFQLERLILFSDAVFAIAITLLVIEIKIPDVHEGVSDKVIGEALLKLIPKFSGFIFSFFLIGLYWTIHHRIFGFVINYDRKVIWLNLLFLFFIVLIPFSTGLYGEYTGPELFREQLKIPLTFYALNLVFLGLANYLMWNYVTNPRHQLADPSLDAQTIRLVKIRSLIVPFVFLLMLFVAYFVNVVLAVYMPMLIPLAIWMVQNRFKKLAKKHPNK